MLIHNLVATGSISYNGVNISYVTGSQTSLDELNQFSASVNTTTGSLNSTTGSLNTATGSLFTASGSFSTRVTNIEGNYATTGSNVFLGAQTVCANITSTGTIIAQTLNVQQVTSSIVYSSGSNIFGCSTSDVQQMTGSLRMTGSIATFSTNCFGIGTFTPLAYNNYVALTVGDNSTTKTGLIKIRSCYNAGDGAEVYQTTAGTFTIATNGSDSAFRIFSNNIASFTCQTCAPGMDIMPSGVGVSTLGGIMRVVTTGTSTGIAVGQSNANRYTHIAANDIQVFNDDFFLTTRCAFPLSIGTCYTARLTFAATGVACFSCQVCVPRLLSNFAADGDNMATFINTSSTFTYNPGGVFIGSSTAHNCGALNAGAGALIIRNGASTYTAAIGYNGNAYFCGNVGIGTAPLTAAKLVIDNTANNTWVSISNLRDGGSSSTYGLSLTTIHRSGGLNGVNHYGAYITPTFGTNSSNIGAAYGAFIQPIASGNYDIAYGYGLYVQALTVSSGTVSNNYAAVFMSGNVGIGTSTPIDNLHVAASETGNVGIAVQNTNASYSAQVRFLNSSGTEKSALTYVQSNDSFVIANNSVNVITITSGGKVNITNNLSDYGFTAVNSNSNGYGIYIQGGGTNNLIDGYNYNAGTALFRVNGAGTIFAVNTSVQSISDIRTKENIITSTDGLNIINSLRPVRFDFKEGFGNNKKNQLGFIAQEVEEVFPDIVDTWKNNKENQTEYKTVGPTGLIPVLVKAIQEQQCKINILESCLGIN